MENPGGPPDVRLVSEPAGRSDDRLRPASPIAATRWWQNRWEAAGWVLFAALLVGSSPWVIYRTTRHTSSDFWGFYSSARYIWEHGVRMPQSKFLHYLPSLDVAFGLVAWLPESWAAVAWLAIMTLAWLCLLAAVRRYLLSDCDATQARQSVLAAGLLVMPLFVDHLCIGAFHVLMVWFMVAGLGRVSRNRPWSGGLMLGLAIWIKLLPLGGVGYLVLKRKWLPAAVAVAAAVAIDLAISLAVLGPESAWQSHRLWLEGEVCGVQNHMLTEVDPIDEDRITNQSIAVVMRHLLTHMGEGLPADRDVSAALHGVTVHPGQVGLAGRGGQRPNVAMANLNAGQLQAAYATVMSLLALAIVIYCRRPGRDLRPGQWATEIALVVLATLWFSPLVWSYHLTAALPALAVVFGCALGSRERPKRSPHCG